MICAFNHKTIFILHKNQTRFQNFSMKILSCFAEWKQNKHLILIAAIKIKYYALLIT